MRLPMPVLPARVLLDGDLDGIAEFALRDLDLGVLALFVGTPSAIVGRRLCRAVSVEYPAMGAGL